MDVRLDHAGIETVLMRGEMVDLVNKTAEQIADAAHYPTPHSDGPVRVTTGRYTAAGRGLMRNRQGATVTAEHPAALGYEARHGVLEAAARAVGAEYQGYW